MGLGNDAGRIPVSIWNLVPDRHKEIFNVEMVTGTNAQVFQHPYLNFFKSKWIKHFDVIRLQNEIVVLPTTFQNPIWDFSIFTFDYLEQNADVWGPIFCQTIYSQYAYKGGYNSRIYYHQGSEWEDPTGSAKNILMMRGYSNNNSTDDVTLVSLTYFSRATPWSKISQIQSLWCTCGRSRTMNTDTHGIKIYVW